MKKIIQLGDAQSLPYRKDELAIASALDGICNVWLEGGLKFVDSLNQDLFKRNDAKFSKPIVNAYNWGEFKENNVLLLSPVVTSSGSIVNNEYIFETDNLIEFSFITVIKPRASTLQRLLYYPTDVTPTGDDHYPFFGITATGTLAYWSGPTSNLRASYALDATDEKIIVLALTFSVDGGVKIYANGKKVAENSDFKQQLSSKKIALSTQLRVQGLGHFIHSNVDLSKIENSAKLNIVHDALLKYYQI